MLDFILERFPDVEFLKVDGFDSAIIGVEVDSMRLVYSERKCIELLCFSGLDYDEAVDHFETNVKGSFLGDKTPIWVFNYS